MTHLEEKYHSATISISPLDVFTQHGDYSRVSYYFENANMFRRVYGVQVESINLTHTFYNVTGSKRTITLLIGGQEYVCTIQEGQYDIDTIRTALQDIIDTSVGASTFVSLTQDTIKKVLVLELSTPFTIVYNNGDLANRLLGFTGAQEDNSSTGNIATATCLPQLGGIRTIYLICKELSGTSYDFGFGNSKSICCFPVTAPFGSLISYKSTFALEALTEYISPKYISEISLEFHDENGERLILKNNIYNVNLKIYYSLER